MNSEYKQYLSCPLISSISAALFCIDKNAKGVVAFHDDEGHIIGIATDGDIRRMLLAGASTHESIEPYVNRDFSWMLAGASRQQYLKALQNKNNIIVLDDSRKLVEIYTYRDVAPLPISAPDLSGNEVEYVLECFNTGWISSQGSFVKCFEEEFAALHEIQYALTTSNGTTALHLALIAVGVQAGDEVIVPCSTFGASANAVIHAGGIPVFVDVCPHTWCLDYRLIEAAITERTKAIMPVHLYGHPCEMERIVALAEKYQLAIVEDCAESLGACINGRLVGTYGHVSCFSFFSNKVITTGEGGMVITANEQLYDTMRQYRDHGSSFQRKYWHDYAGYNYRMTNIQAAVGLAQLERLESFLSHRLAIAYRYSERLKSNNFLTLPVSSPGFKNIYWLYTVLLSENAPLSRDAFIKELAHQGVDARPFFPALFHQPAYASTQHVTEGHFPTALKLERCGLSLPTSNVLSLDDVNRVCDAIERILK